ncbi:FAS-associated death domain protein-like [Alosa alosa]|uniref:FAS-associated death domain protein-like n=1 Tax=Alosa alosa TaxID=278164 RepID=UPI0020151026|nr:FAS-associated death domain protein-like [Alosa alosa]
MNAEQAFNAMLLDISNELNEKNLEELKFLCSNKIGKKHLENVKVGIDLFRHLKEVNELRLDDATFLSTLLNQIKRRDLFDKVQVYMQNNATRDIGLTETEEQAKVKIAVDVIVANLGTRWRQYARKLGLHDAKLDQIREKHPFNLEEQVMEVINVWKGMHKEDVKAAVLIEALRSCKLNHTADLVEKEIAVFQTTRTSEVGQT